MYALGPANRRQCTLAPDALRRHAGAVDGHLSVIRSLGPPIGMGFDRSAHGFYVRPDSKIGFFGLDVRAQILVFGAAGGRQCALASGALSVASGGAEATYDASGPWYRRPTCI